MNVNKLFIIGRVGRDPEMRTTKEGKPVCNFSVAVENGRGDQKATEWFEVSCWNRLAETMGEYLVKGQSVCVQGAVSLQTYQKRDGTNGAKLAITAFSIDLGEKSKGQANADDRQQEQQAPTPRPPFVPKDKQGPPPSDDIPF